MIRRYPAGCFWLWVAFKLFQVDNCFVTKKRTFFCFLIFFMLIQTMWIFAWSVVLKGIHILIFKIFHLDVWLESFPIKKLIFFLLWYKYFQFFYRQSGKWVKKIFFVWFFLFLYTSVSQTGCRVNIFRCRKISWMLIKRSRFINSSSRGCHKSSF